MSEEQHIAFVDEKSAHDQILSALAIVVLLTLFAAGIYWQTLPLPSVVSDSENSEK
jgi:ABC-type microcin C transport system permease subunit YejB